MLTFHMLDVAQCGQLLEEYKEKGWKTYPCNSCSRQAEKRVNRLACPMFSTVIG
jgi:hypothetical protein